MKMVQVLCCDGYGSMLWELRSNPAEQFSKYWNNCVKLAWRVPLSTFTYLVEGYFASEQISLRNQILSRYPGFFRNLLSSPSKEVRILARMVSADPRSTTCSNLRYLRELTGMDNAEYYTSWKIRETLPIKKVPECEHWRLGLLTSLLGMRCEKNLQVQDNKTTCAMLDSLWAILLVVFAF